MPLEPANIFYDLLNIQSPWQIDVLMYNKHNHNLDVYLSLNVTTIFCPLCNRGARIIGKRSMKWTYLDLFEYKTEITTYLPVIGAHNPQCRAEYDQSAMRNTLLLDLVLRMVKGTGILKPLDILFSSVDSSCEMRSL